MKTEKISFVLVSKQGREVMGFDDEARARERKKGYPFLFLKRRTMIEEILPN